MAIIETNNSKRASKLLKALEEDWSGVLDSEGRSPLDFLVIDLQNMSLQRRLEWVGALVQLVQSRGIEGHFNWSAIERLVILGGLQSQTLGVALEEALAERRIKDPHARAIIYSLLDVCGMPPTAAVISNDDQLRTFDRLRWLDLMITRVPRLEDAQQLVIGAVSDRQFSIEDFRVRLNEMRHIGGSRLGDWIRKFRSRINDSERASFDVLVDEAFGPLTTIAEDEKKAGISDPDSRSVRTLALLDPVGASLPVGLAFRRWRPTTRHRRHSAETKAMMALTQRAFSYNRDAQLQYHYLASRRHKAVREALSSAGPGLRQVEKALVAFLEFLNQRFYEATAKNFELLHAYYSSKGGVAPRICLKGTFRVNTSETVVSIFRDHDVDYEKQSDASIERNSGFFHIKETGSYFLENNLPSAVLQGRYVNPRLDTDAIHSEFRGKGQLSQLNNAWDRYWIGNNDTRTNDSSNYKSTLIVPLTLSVDNLTDDFRKEVPLEDVDRTVFGFLCFDHREVGYFDESTDVSIGQIFAGFLCHFVFTRLIFTDMSSTFKAVSALLGGRLKKLNLLKVDQLSRAGHMQSVQTIREQPQRQSVTNNFIVMSEHMTSAPKLQDLDQVLIDFAVKQPIEQ